MKPEIAAMSREEYMRFRGVNEGITITETDLACARHHDNCSICQLDEQTRHAQNESADKHDRARAILAGGITQYRQELEALREKAQRGEAIPTNTEILDAVIKGLKKLSNAHHRVWSK